MLDIFVMALVVLAIKGLPGGTTVALNWGVIAFTASILLTLKVPAWILAASRDAATPASSE